MKVSIFSVLIVSFFVGTVVHADIQLAVGATNATKATGYIFCPANEKITHFELAFDSSSSARDDVPYDLRINGNLIYSNRTPWSPVTSGYYTFATTTPVSHPPVDCYGMATWEASSTSPTGESFRYYRTDINAGSYIFTPNYTFTSADRVVTNYVSSSPTTQYIVGGKFRFANTPFYLATSTPSSGGDSYTVEVLDTEIQKTLAFLLLLLTWVIPLLLFIYLTKPFYDRK